MLGRTATSAQLASAVVLAILLGGHPGFTRTWYVDARGTGDAIAIQDAIERAAAGDTILVAPGSYDENLDTRGKPLTLIGQSGAETTMVDGGYRARVLTFSGGGLLEGFTLRRGQDFHGGGVRVSGMNKAVLRRNIIEDNHAGFEIDGGHGGGIWLDYTTAGVLVESNVIRNNIAGDQGGGVYDEGGQLPENRIVNNTVAGNASYNDGAGLYMSGGDVVGNLIAANFSTNGSAGLHIGGGLGVTEVEHNTFIGNESSNSANEHGVGIAVLGTPLIRGNIIAYNHAAGGLKGAAIWCGVFAAPVIECNAMWANDINDVTGNAPCVATETIREDPEFCAVDPITSLDVRLQSDSPCVPGNHPGTDSCGLIGAAPVGCGSVSVEYKTWSDVRLLYR